MGFSESKFWKWWKSYGEHFTAPLILIALVIAGWQLYDYNQLQGEISQNCGWGEEKYHCVCAKNFVQGVWDARDGDVEVNLTNFEYYRDLETGEVLEHPEGVYNQGWNQTNVTLVK